MKDITRLTVKQLLTEQSKGLSCTDITKAYLDNIQACDSSIGAYLTVLPQQALQRAAAMDECKCTSALHGIPAGIKDNICTKGVRTTCASKMLAEFTPMYDATAMQKLHNAGCVTLGKLNMDEFAMGASTETSAFKITHNPVDLSCVPGGSSGGSAAAVAAFEAAFALGSDTGGSIRQPASFCGVVGMKPTYGRVSRYGLVAFASSLDQIGPITRTVEDNALVLDVLSGRDALDSTSIDSLSDCTQDIGKDIKGIHIALPKEFFEHGIAPGVRDAVLKAAKTLEGLGAIIVEESMPSLKEALSAYYIISSAEASSNLARFDGIKYGLRADAEDLESIYKNSRSEGFGAEVKRRIMLGSFVLSAGYYDAYYKRALQVRTKIMNDFKRIFAHSQCILSPVCPTVAYPIGEKITDPLAMYMGDIYTVPVNIAGLPALSVPCGADNGMPVNAQLIGSAFSEKLLYRCGHALECQLRSE